MYLATEVTEGPRKITTLDGRNQVIYCLNELAYVIVPPSVCDLRRLKTCETQRLKEAAPPQMAWEPFAEELE